MRRRPSEVIRLSPRRGTVVPTYCGDGPVPDGKVRGSPKQCLQKGVGVGLYVLAPKKYNLDAPPPRPGTDRDDGLSSEDIYDLARKLRVPVRTPDGTVRPVEDVYTNVSSFFRR